MPDLQSLALHIAAANDAANLVRLLEVLLDFPEAVLEPSAGPNYVVLGALCAALIERLPPASRAHELCSAGYHDAEESILRLDANDAAPRPFVQFVFPSGEHYCVTLSTLFGSLCAFHASSDVDGPGGFPCERAPWVQKRPDVTIDARGMGGFAMPVDTFHGRSVEELSALSGTALLESGATFGQEYDGARYYRVLDRALRELWVNRASLRRLFALLVPGVYVACQQFRVRPLGPAILTGNVHGAFARSSAHGQRDTRVIPHELLPVINGAVVIAREYDALRVAEGCARIRIIAASSVAAPMPVMHAVDVVPTFRLWNAQFDDPDNPSEWRITHWDDPRYDTLGVSARIGALGVSTLSVVITAGLFAGVTSTQDGRAFSYAEVLGPNSLTVTHNAGDAQIIRRIRYRDAAGQNREGTFEFEACPAVQRAEEGRRVDLAVSRNATGATVSVRSDGCPAVSEVRMALSPDQELFWIAGVQFEAFGRVRLVHASYSAPAPPSLPPPRPAVEHTKAHAYPALTAVQWRTRAARARRAHEREKERKRFTHDRRPET